jgi:hypothetical protein
MLEFLPVCLLATTAFAGGTTAAATIAPADTFRNGALPLLREFCFECHGGGNSAGDLDLDAIQSPADVSRATDTWQKLIRYARSDVMPPPEAERRPTQAQRERLVAALQALLYDPANPDPGPVTPRRLNRTEYRNTIRDLLGVPFDPTLDFPQDDTGYGFDNIADVLTLSPLLMEKYLAAANKILDEAIPTRHAPRRMMRVRANEARATFTPQDRRGGANVPDGWVALGSEQEDALSTRLDVPAPGDYLLRVLACALPDSPAAATTPTTRPATRPATLSLMLNDAVVLDVEVTADVARPQWYEARLGAAPGRQLFKVAVRRQRGVTQDAFIRDGRVGEIQAGRVAVKEIVIDGPVRGTVQRLAADRLGLGGQAARYGGDAVALVTTRDEATGTFDVATTGEYLIRVQACADQAGTEPAKMEIRLDDRPIEVFAVDAPSQYKPAKGDGALSERARRAVPRVYEVRARLAAGTRRVAARFLNDAYFPDDPRPNFRDRNLFVQHIEIVDLSGDPQSLPIAPPLRATFARHEPKATGVTTTASRDAARKILDEFARRAWQRPVAAEDLDRLVQLYDLATNNGETFRESVKHAMSAALVSPRFLFRGIPAAATPPSTAPVQPQAVDEFELAARLSYFLWSSTPDDELLDLAGRAELRANLDAQVKRMLASPKSQALVDNFAGQWLQFRNLDAAHPDDKAFAAYDDRLRDDMKRETRLFFQSILESDRSLLDVLDADYTFVNERLATHYGIKGVSGEQFRRVSLAGLPRRGVMTQGSVLTLTSNPTRTSPVKRGKWVLENLLGTAPPPPPPDIPPLDQSDGKPITGTLRQRLEKHRADPACASCHAPMDPIGFALENFDAIGRWRDKDAGAKIDAASSMPDGTKVSGPIDVAEILVKTRRNDFYRSVAENALTFALGRGVEPYDQPAVDRIVEDLRQTDGRFSSLINGVVNSMPFQMRRGGGMRDEHATPSAAAR